MGRYYTGDIEGKFWFGVQSSEDASFFGGEETEPNCIDYWFDETHIRGVKKGIKECEKKLGKYEKKLRVFFAKKEFYNDEELEKELRLSKEKGQEFLTWYARLLLGKKILKCLKKQGTCAFSAEL